MPKPILSDTARAVFTAAAARDDHVALPPERLPAAAQRAVVQSLLRAGLLERLPPRTTAACTACQLSRPTRSAHALYR